MTQSTWIETRSGRRFDVANPREEDVHIEDIAVALAHTCRFGGHALRWISVGWHSVVVHDVVAMLCELAAHEKTPSRSASGHEFMAALEKSLGRLPEDLRTAVTLRYIQGMSPTEIAGKMDRTERAVHQLCYRGVQMVRRELRSASMFI